MSSALCLSDDVDGLLSLPCVVSALVPAVAGALVLVLSAVRLGQISAPRSTLLRLPQRTSNARVLALLASVCATAAAAWVRWPDCGWLERGAECLSVAGWALALLASLTRLPKGGWHIAAAAGLAAAAAAAPALALARVPGAEAWADASAPPARVAVAAGQLAAAVVLACVCACECAGWLPSLEAPPLLEPLLGVTADGGGNAACEDLPASARTCPEAAAGLLSRVFFLWMGPMLEVGAKRPLGPDDLWSLDASDRADTLAARWARAPRGSGCARCLREVVGRRFLEGAVFRLLSDCSQLATPVVLHALLDFLQAPAGQGRGRGFGVCMALLLFASQLAQSLCDNQYFWRVLRCGLQARAVLVRQISAKVLRLSHAARGRHSSGRLNALIAADAEAVELSLGTLHLCWSAVLRICVALGLLYGQLGPSAFAALGSLLLLIPLQTSLVLRSARAQKRGLQHTDERVKALAEAAGAITTLKCYAWEEPAIARVLGCREAELKWLRVRVLLNGLNFAMLSLNLTLMAAATFSTYTLLGGTLDASRTFTAIALFGNLQGPLFLVPQAISQAVSARVSLRRLDELLLAEELPAMAAAQWTERAGGSCAREPPGAGEPPEGVAIELRGADFAWEAEGGGESGPAADGGGLGARHASHGASPLLAPTGGDGAGARRSFAQLAPALRGVRLRIAEGALVAVVGGTGEGKSSLLSAILGDLPALQPELAPRVRGSVAYCAQVSWVFPGSVRDNILFGRPFDARRYEEALWAADLDADLAQMGGDGAELGERGVNVSGGQKQRLSLARAFYADADIYVLDDVLSALDAAVASRIFERLLLRGLRDRGKTCVFATNRLEFVGACSEVVVVSEGAVLDSGPVAEVRGRCAFFAALMEGCAGEQGGGGEQGAQERADEQELDGRESDAPPASADVVTAGAPPSACAPPAPRALPSARTLVEAEHREQGQLSAAVLRAYLSAAGGPLTCALVAGLFGAKTGCDYAANWWLSQWSAASGSAPPPLGGGARSTGWWLGGYLLVQLCGVCLTLASQVGLALCGLRASRELAARLSSGLLCAPLSFFHANPLGRLLNVAAKDQRDVDQVLVSNLAITLMVAFSLLATLLVIVASFWWTLLVIGPLLAFFYTTRSAYQRSLIEIKRWGAVSRSPVYVLFSQCLDGLFTIRAYRASAHMLARMSDLVDANIRWDLAEQAASRWLSMRLAAIGGLLTLACALGAVLTRAPGGGGGDAAAVGLMLSYALNLSFSLVMVTRLSSQTENSFNAVERVAHYAGTPPENGGLERGADPPSGWPSAGRLDFAGVCVRYRPDLPDVLTNLTFSVGAADKVGIVGRTGAGKSSLVSALFRLVQPYRGSVLIDGADALCMKLSALRRQLGIIPQEPVLLSGSVRYNLDPFGQASDLELWGALRQAHLADYVAQQPAALDAQVAEGGANLSIGQRQLLCMARALVRRCRVLVMDEATAAVDSETDRLIQTALRLAFKAATVLTIAHRLHTVIDSTHVLLLAGGRVREYGPPHALLSDPASEFSRLVDATGQAAAAALRATAASVAAGGAAEPLPPPRPHHEAAAASDPPARPPFAKQPSNRQRSAAFASLATVRAAGAGLSSRRGTADSGSVVGLGAPLSPLAGGAGRPVISLDAVRLSIEQLGAAVREGGRGLDRQAHADWYGELGAVLSALAREAERARHELEDEDGADGTTDHAREDSTVLSTQA